MLFGPLYEFDPLKPNYFEASLKSKVAKAEKYIQTNASADILLLSPFGLQNPLETPAWNRHLISGH